MSDSKKEAIFLNGIFLKEVTFKNGGSLINVNIPDVRDFISQLEANENDDGGIRLEIRSRKEATVSQTHYMTVSEFKPSKDYGKKAGSKGKESGQKANYKRKYETEEGSDIPF